MVAFTVTVTGLPWPSVNAGGRSTWKVTSALPSPKPAWRPLPRGRLEAGDRAELTARLRLAGEERREVGDLQRGEVLARRLRGGRLLEVDRLGGLCPKSAMPASASLEMTRLNCGATTTTAPPCDGLVRLARVRGVPLVIDDDLVLVLGQPAGRVEDPGLHLRLAARARVPSGLRGAILEIGSPAPRRQVNVCWVRMTWTPPASRAELARVPEAPTRSCCSWLLSAPSTAVTVSVTAEPPGSRKRV